LVHPIYPCSHHVLFFPIVRAVDNTSIQWSTKVSALYDKGCYPEALDAFNESLSINQILKMHRLVKETHFTILANTRNLCILVIKTLNIDPN